MSDSLSLSSRIALKIRRISRRIQLTKRQEFVLITLFLTGGLLLTQVVSTDYRFVTVFALSFITYWASAFAMRDNLSGAEWVTLLTLPTCFTAAIAVFYFLLPVRWLTRIPFVVVYAISMYALLLTENIYNVAANRTIALLRAAHTVGFLLTLIVFFLLTQTLVSLRLPGYINMVGVGIAAFILAVQILWSVVLEPVISVRIYAMSVASAIALTQISWMLAFLPVNTTIEALFLTTCFYAFTAMGQQYLQDKLYKKTVIEYSVVVGIIFVALLFSMHWRG